MENYNAKTGGHGTKANRVGQSPPQGLDEGSRAPKHSSVQCMQKIFQIHAWDIAKRLSMAIKNLWGKPYSKQKVG